MMNTVRRGSSHDGSWLELDMMMMNDDEVTTIKSGSWTITNKYQRNRKRIAFGKDYCSQFATRNSKLEARSSKSEASAIEGKAKRSGVSYEYDI
jgi:hypothetical protein